LLFHDRTEAGRLLADRLAAMEFPDPVVLAIPRGGVTVAAPIASRLVAELGLALARKIGAPFNEELAIGAVGDDGSVVLSTGLLRRLGVSKSYVDGVVAHERTEIDRRRRGYLGDRPPLDVAGKTAIIVDDGLATGATAEAAVMATRHKGASGIIVAAPVASAEAVRRLEAVADQVIVLEVPAYFQAVGQFYERFEQVDDDSVRRSLASEWAKGV
jgi:putative phosphoribosyl transferase